MNYNDNGVPVKRRASNESDIPTSDTSAGRGSQSKPLAQHIKFTPASSNNPRPVRPETVRGRRTDAPSANPSDAHTAAPRTRATAAGMPARVQVRPAEVRQAAHAGARPQVKAPSPVGASGDYVKRSGTAPTRASSAARPAPARRAQGSGIRHRRRSRTPVWVSAILAVCAVLLLCVGFVGFKEVGNYMSYLEKCSKVNQKTFYEGITLEGSPLSGLTLDDALDKYGRQIGDVAMSTQLTINARGNSYVIDSSAVQMNSNLQAMLSEAYAIGRSGSLDERYASIQYLAANGLDFSLDRGWNDSTLSAKIKEIADAVYVKGKNATVEDFDPDSGKFTFSGEVTGYKLDADDLYRQITQAIANGNVTATIEAKVDEIQPEYDIEYMKEHFGRISMEKTHTTSDRNRNKNISLATALFDGMRVDPGETVSFNKVTGRREESKGYKPAGAYSGGVFVEEPGGGVCQVSTTLYNAVVKADLQIIDRSPHNRPSGYIGIGLDAAVNYPSQDFAFKNNTDFPIFISASFHDREIVFKIYGHQMDDGVYIMLESEKTETLYPPAGIKDKPNRNMPTGTSRIEKAREGAKAVSYKVYYDRDNNEIKREVLDHSTYNAAPAYNMIGTG